jgi:hypothetical protein
VRPRDQTSQEKLGIEADNGAFPSGGAPFVTKKPTIREETVISVKRGKLHHIMEERWLLC